MVRIHTFEYSTDCQTGEREVEMHSVIGTLGHPMTSMDSVYKRWLCTSRDARTRSRGQEMAAFWPVTAPWLARACPGLSERAPPTIPTSARPRSNRRTRRPPNSPCNHRHHARGAANGRIILVHARTERGVGGEHVRDGVADLSRHGTPRA
jgi:hypothetical protein